MYPSSVREATPSEARLKSRPQRMHRPRPDLHVLREMRQAGPSASAPPPPPSAARLPQAAPGSNTSAMRAKIEAAKAGSADIEAKLRALTGKGKVQKKRTALQTHQRDWNNTNAELQRQRAELESARALWLQVEADRPAAEAAGAPLRSLAPDDAAADATRREWSVEMRCQLADLRELCAAEAKRRSLPAAAQAGLGRSLLGEISRSLAVQSDRLSATAAALDAELQAHTASILADDDAAASGGSTGSVGADGASASEVAALVELEARAAFGGSSAERSDGEKRLLEALGAGLRAEEEQHREALHALRDEYADAFEHGAAEEEGDDGDDEEEGDGGVDEGGGGGTGEHREGNREADGDDGSLLVAGDYYVLAEAGDAGDGGGGAAAAAIPAAPVRLPAAANSGGAAARGWDSTHQARLVKLEREFRGRPRGALLARLRLELPGQPLDLLEGRLSALGRRRAYATRRRALLVSWDAKKSALVRSARHLMQEQAAAEGKLQLQRAEREALDARRGELHAELAVLERVRAQRQAEEAAEAEAAAAVAAAVADAHKAKAEAERAHKKAMIEAYQLEQEEHKREAEMVAAEEERARAAEQVAVAEYNLKRVTYRAELHAEREKLQAEQKEHERLLGEEQALRLMRVREQAIAAMGVTADPERATGPTAASEAEVFARAELFPVHGYADATLMKDVRFKLGHALRNAGLNGTEYARNLLCDHKRWGGPARPDAIVSNVPFGDGS